MRFIKGLFSFIIYLLMILIFCITVYFCLEVFGIVEVPNQFSIAKYFYSEIETIATSGENLEEVVDVNKRIIKEEPIYGFKDTNTIVENTTSITNTTEEIIDFSERLAELEKASKGIGNNETPAVQATTADLNNTNAKKFHYSQLDNYGKIIYDGLYNNREFLKSGTYDVDYGKMFNDLLNTEGGEELLNNDFQLAINALIFDNPEFYYLNVTDIYLLTRITTRLFSKTYTVSIGPNGGNYVIEDFRNEATLRDSITKVESAKKYLVDKIYNDDVDKIKAVHDYLVNNIDYNGDKESTAYGIYGALVDRRAVCEGYAKAFKYILDDMGIPCIVVRGIAKNNEGESEGHAWNYVKVNNEWYAVDVTWDDPIITGFGTISDERKYKYFLKGANEFFENHYEDGSIMDNIGFDYPRLSVINYK